jgi:hypothetical protein
MIRLARHEDIPAMVAMGREFHAAAGWSDIAEYVDQDCTTSLSAMIDQPSMVVIVMESDSQIVGMAGGVSSPIYFNHSVTLGQELFFWINPESRGGGLRFKKSLEQYARDIGCEAWIMIALHSIRPDATGAFYRRGGYRAAEQNWIKRL